MRTGIGYDIHRLIPTIKPSAIILGGIKLPCYFSLQAHSDGDVLLHALVDACLGALALGDIGQWFPDKDPKHQNRASSEFVKEVIEKVHQLGFEIHQIDSNVFLEEPKVAPHSDSIRSHIAQLVGTELSNVSLKAKTMEGLGPIGERKAISAQVVVTLKETPKKHS
ncbi:MAG: 2-C-methyl-D-erythritol 2,4-cyclodiphosphate synthase [Proteobacteria bacterium]|jgi:2-C-methyl-D-erythritol 2,4-cyclodiphosphate synthase|nr:2-C-methyl-D-erythritol 2,4-cyclodiphosphate synthase [Pseudomonadota bacterium]NBY19319.1 2-C-methyl-D-erythritol 2,4-cyclodiphosphate synthase [bacterium]